MPCTSLTLTCLKKTYVSNTGLDSLFCGIQVVCDGNARYIRAPFVADFTGNSVRLRGWDKSETYIDDVTVSGKTLAEVKTLFADCNCGIEQYLTVNNTPVGYIPTVTGNTSNLNEVIIDTAGRTWIIDINGDARLFSNGTVTSVGLSASGALNVSGSPITTSGTIALNWTGTSSQYVRGDGSLATFPSIPSITPSALTKTNDTNVTLTLGGTPATALLEAVSLTLGWTGILAIGRGGTGLGTLGTVNQLLRVNSGGTALEYFSPTWTSNTGTVTSVAASVGGTALGVSGTPITSSGTLAFAWAGTSGQYVDGQGNLQNFPAIPAGTVTSVNASISGALSVSGGPITTSGTLAFSWTGTSGQYVRGDGSLATFPSIPAGTVTSVALALPSNTFDISGSPVTSLGTLTGDFKSQIKKTVLAAPWGADGTPIWRQLQTSDLQQNGATTGQVITWNGTEWAAANPTGGVTSVAAGNGMNFTTITASGSVVLGTPSSITLASTNSVTSTSHTHAFAPGGTSSQYIKGDGTLATFPAIPVVNWADERVAFGRTGSGGLSHDWAFLYHYNYGAITIGSRAAGAIGTYSVVFGNYVLNASNYSLAIGYSLSVNAASDYSFVMANDSGTQLTGSGNKTLSFVHGTNNKIKAGTNDAYRNVIIGYSNVVDATSVRSVDNVIIGSNCNVTNNSTNRIIGHYINTSQYGTFTITDDTSSALTITTARIFTGRFENGYSFFKNASTRMMELNSSGQLTIDNLAGSGTRMVVANSTGLLSTQAIPSGASAVWKIQGGSTDATTNTDNIYHNAKVRIGDSTASSFQLSVVGQAYISSGALINNSVYYSAYASDAVATELLGITSSNLIKVGAPKSGSKSFDIYLPNYTSSRAADTMSAGDSFLFAASSGVMYKQGGQWVRNYGASVFTTADESHIADSTPRRVTFDSYVCNNDYSYFSYSFSSGDYKVAGATGQMFMVICTLEYTTSGTPTVTAQLRVGGATQETNISTSADGRKVMTIHTVTAGGGSGNFECYLSVSGSAITLKKCRLSVMPLGAECP